MSDGAFLAGFEPPPLPVVLRLGSRLIGDDPGVGRSVSVADSVGLALRPGTTIGFVAPAPAAPGAEAGAAAAGVVNEARRAWPKACWNSALCSEVGLPPSAFKSANALSEAERLEDVVGGEEGELSEPERLRPLGDVEPDDDPERGWARSDDILDRIVRRVGCVVEPGSGARVVCGGR